jgi:xylobiose transport system substrate-binding protein
LDTAASPEYAKFQYDLVKKAPAFQLSWDQAYPQSATTTMYQSLQQFFNGSMDEDAFIKAMQALPTS